MRLRKNRNPGDCIGAIVCKCSERVAVEEVHDRKHLEKVIPGYVGDPGNRVRRPLIDAGATPTTFRMTRKVAHVYY
jgi:hypothetical protein